MRQRKQKLETVQQVLSEQPHLERENQAEAFLFWLIWGGKNMPIKLGVRAIASGSFQVNPAAVCLK